MQVVAVEMARVTSHTDIIARVTDNNSLKLHHRALITSLGILFVFLDKE